MQVTLIPSRQHASAVGTSGEISVFFQRFFVFFKNALGEANGANDERPHER